jgi:zinc protease
MGTASAKPAANPKPSVAAQASTPAKAATKVVAKKVTSVEGITEYVLPNGLRVLLFPDPASSVITVNLTYLVGSRHEGYGETGMAQLARTPASSKAPKDTPTSQRVDRTRRPS